MACKLESDVEIKASPEQFHDMLANKPHHVHYASNDKVQGCDLHEGEWGKVGSIINWRILHDGEPKVIKEVVEAIDSEKNLITLKVIDGDMMKAYKNFSVTFQALPKSDGGSGSVVHFTIEYEKLHDEIPHPESFLEQLKDVAKDMDAHLTQAN